MNLDYFEACRQSLAVRIGRPGAAAAIACFCMAAMPSIADEDHVSVWTFTTKGIYTATGGGFACLEAGNAKLKFFLQREKIGARKGRSLKLDYTGKITGDCRFVVHLFDTESDTGEPDNNRVDLATFPYLSFMIRAETDLPGLAVGLIMSDTAESESYRELGSIGSFLRGSVSESWQEVAIDTRNMLPDAGACNAIVFRFAGKKNQTLYLNDLSFRKNLDAPSSFAKLIEREAGSAVSAAGARPASPLLPIWNFDRSIVTDQKGFYNHFSATGSSASVHLVKTARRGAGGRSCKIDYAKSAAGYCGVWFHLFNDSDASAERNEENFVDVSRHPYLSFWIRGESGGEDITVQMANPTMLGREDSRPAGNVSDFLKGPVSTTWQEVVVPYKAFGYRDDFRASCLVFNIKTAGSGTVYIDDMTFKADASTAVPESASAAATGAVPEARRPRAMWVWKVHELIAPEKDANRRDFFAFCEKQGVTEIFLQMPYTFVDDLTDDVTCEIGSPGQLRSLIAEASSHQIRVHALDGYPEFVLDEHHPRVLAQVRAIIDFNKHSQPDERYFGIHLDNEPYQLLGFEQDDQAIMILEQFLDLNVKVMDLLREQKSDIVYGIDIPFWFDEARNDRGNLKYMMDYNGVTQDVAKHLIDIVDNIGIMNYRNFAGGADGIIRHGQDEVEYAEKRGKKIYLGVETFRYDATPVRFIYANRNGPAGPPSATGGTPTSRIANFPVRAINAGSMKLLGLVEPQGVDEKLAYNAALVTLYESHGVAKEEPSDVGKMDNLAQEIINSDDRYEGFAPLQPDEFKGSVKPMGFDTTEQMLAKITFAGRTKAEMDEVLAEVAEHFGSMKSFAGFAVHYYETYAAMPDN